MLASRPRFVLFAEADEPGWRFALHNAATGETVTACDEESDAGPERLGLIALVRGLEALDQPSEVTVVTRNASIARGLQRGLGEWRNNHWRWECFGRLVPVRNADLWRRIDHALNYHRVSCQTWSLNEDPHAALASTQEAPSSHEPPLSDHRHRVDSPTVLILPAARRRRRVRLAPRRATAVAG